MVGQIREKGEMAGASLVIAAAVGDNRGLFVCVLGFGSILEASPDSRGRAAS